MKVLQLKELVEWVDGKKVVIGYQATPTTINKVPAGHTLKMVGVTYNADDIISKNFLVKSSECCTSLVENYLQHLGFVKDHERHLWVEPTVEDLYLKCVESIKDRIENPADILFGSDMELYEYSYIIN